MKEKTPAAKPLKESGKYVQAIGKRKTAVAQIRISDKKGGQITINHKKITEYFPDLLLQEIINSPLKITNKLGLFEITVIVRGGGKKGQAEAIRLGIARALQFHDKTLRKTLKVAGFLRRDSRIKERKKPGLKRARRAPQWSKR